MKEVVDIMGKPKWMIEREQKKVDERNELIEYIKNITVDIEDAINELYKKVNAIADEKQRELVLKETNNSICYFRKSLEQAPTFCFNGKQLRGIYDLVLKHITDMTKTIEEVFNKTNTHKK